MDQHGERRRKIYSIHAGIFRLRRSAHSLLVVVKHGPRPHQSPRGFAGMLRSAAPRRQRAGKASSLMVSFIPFASVSLLCALDRVGKGNSEPKSAARVSV